MVFYCYTLYCIDFSVPARNVFLVDLDSATYYHAFLILIHVYQGSGDAVELEILSNSDMEGMQVAIFIGKERGKKL
ncbi:MAG: hypothetical protein N2442_01805 [Spirochaetes bacterium]|nr:hypothetical protein [Spirochaetota bacterium]